ncbi:MAG: efflux RND transporter permease subunit [Planctomycetes bacterium]|nr:efflux RND transporter permease subunit [Planctomycetota bacterium]
MSDPAPHGAAHRLFAALVRRPVTSLMLFLTLMGTGVLAYRRIPLTLFPRGLSQSSFSITLPFPGAAPHEVEDQLTRVVEDELETIPGVSEMNSISSEGGAFISVEFGNSVDMDVAYGEVRDRIERVRSRLPPEMDRYRIRRWNSNTDMPVMWMGIQYDAEADDPFGPLERIVVPRLEGVDGVAQVGLMGVVDEAVRIFVDMDKSSGYGIDLGALIRRMQTDNFTLPAGQVDDGGRTFALRLDARFRDIDEIKRYPVGNGLVLSDIADVVQARAYRDSVWRINGQAAAGLSVSRESDENTIDVCTRVEEVIEQLKADPRLSDITFNVFFNQKDTILDAIVGLQASALWGGLFAVIVLFLFLRDTRMTIIAALAIPSSLLTALMCVYFGGQTLNLISLAGFTLGIGMLVDNAVVVIENIASKRAEGLSRTDAAAAGAGEVALAVLTATGTSMVVFLPLVFMGGDRNTRVMMREVGLPISWSLAASLLVALVFLPTFTAVLVRKIPKVASQGLEGRRTLLVRSYERVMAFMLRHRFGASLVLLAIVAMAGQMSQTLHQSFSAGGQNNGVEIGVDMPSTYSLSDANEVFQRLEEWAAEHQEEMGYDFYSSRFDRRGGDIRFYPKEGLDHEVKDSMPWRIQSGLPELPGVTYQASWQGGEGGKDLRVDLHGPDFGVLASIADDLRDELAKLKVDKDGEQVPLLDNVKTDLDKGLDEVHVLVDRDRASELGVSPELVRGMVAWGLGGQRLPDLQVGDRDVRVQIEYAQNDVESLELLRGLSLRTDKGAKIPLASVASLEFEKALGSLVRRNGETSTGVTGRPSIDNLALTSRLVADVLENYPFPDGYSWSEQGGQGELGEDVFQLLLTLLFSFVLVYILIAILTESVVLPVIIQYVATGLGIVGVILALAATNRPLEPMVYVGMILLAGIVVNNSILMVDHVERLRKRGLDRNAALVRGGSDRLRPILMTSLTTIFGLMPMANPKWFPGSGQESGYESMAIAVAGGLCFSTVFTLLFVPLFHSLLDDAWRVFLALLPMRFPAHGEDLEGERDAELPPAGGAAEPVPMGPASDT